MKTAKKVLALLLSVLMVFTMVSSSVVAIAETEPAEKTQIEDVENSISNTFDSIKGIIEGVHNLVGGIMSVLGKECVFCDEIHGKTEDTEEPTEPETPPSEPEVPVEPEEPTEPETPVEPEEPTEPEKPEADKPVEDQVGDAFDSINKLFDSIHNLVGGILAIFGKECPFCDKVHGEEDTFILTYNYGIAEDGNYVKSQKVQVGTIPVEPEIPENDKYLFEGWYENSDFSKAYYFEEVLETDIEIFAKWSELTPDNEILVDTDISEEINNMLFEKDKKGISKIDFSVSDSQAINGVEVSYELTDGVAEISVKKAIGLINNICGAIGTPVDITLTGDDTLKKAKISFSYDEKMLPDDIDESKLGIVWFDEAKKKMVLLEDSIVDINTNTVSVETNHFSKYVVVDTDAWTASWAHKQLVTRDDKETLRFNIVLCIDDSGSMSGQKRTICQQAARNFVDQLLDGDHIAVIRFNSYATTLVYPTRVGDTGKESIKNSIQLNASGGTNFNNAINASISMLQNMPEVSNDNEILKNYIVFLSDGQSSVGGSQLAELAKWGYNVLAIGVGNGVSAAELQKMANASGGSYAHVSDPSQIASIFEQIQGEYIGLSIDSDGDKIADLVEKTGMIGTDRLIYRTDPNNHDTDGDGLSDSYEMGIYDDAIGTFDMISSPTTPTYVDDEAKYSATFAVKAGVLQNDTSLESYKSVKATFRFDVEKYHIYDDLLSDVLYSDAKNFKVEILVDGKPEYGYHAEIQKAGTSYTKTYIIKDLSMGDHSIKFVVKSDNGKTIEQEYYYNPYDYWYAALLKAEEEKTDILEREGTRVIRAYAQNLKEKEDNLKNVVVLNESSIGYVGKYPDGLETAIENKIAAKIIALAKEYSNKSGIFSSNSPSDLVNEVAALLEMGSEEFNVTVGKDIYSVKKENIGIMYSGFGTIKATNNRTNVTYNYVFNTTTDVIENNIEYYMDECKLLADAAIEDCINATLSDAGKILHIDDIKRFVDGKIGKQVEAYLAGKNVKVSYSELKTACNYYKKAKKAIEAAYDVDKKPSEKNVTKAIESSYAYFDFINKNLK